MEATLLVGRCAENRPSICLSFMWMRILITMKGRVSLFKCIKILESIVNVLKQKTTCLFLGSITYSHSTSLVSSEVSPTSEISPTRYPTCWAAYNYHLSTWMVNQLLGISAFVWKSGLRHRPPIEQEAPIFGHVVRIEIMRICKSRNVRRRARSNHRDPPGRNPVN